MVKIVCAYEVHSVFMYMYKRSLYIHCTCVCACTYTHVFTIIVILKLHCIAYQLWILAGTISLGYDIRADLLEYCSYVVILSL